MKLLIAYDGSEHAQAAVDDLRHAGLPANVDALVLTVADVWPHLIDQGRAADDPLANPALQRLTRRARDEANQKMSEAKEVSRHGAERLQLAYPSWTVRADTIAGTPSWKLIQRAEELGSDLIVVGCQGHSAINRLMLGSVAQQVLHHATCSVRVGRSSTTIERNQERPTRILLAVDGSLGAANAVSAVASRSWRPGTTVKVFTAADYRVLLYMLDSGEAFPVPQPHVPWRAEKVDEYATRRPKEVCKELERHGLQAEPMLQEGDPKLEILREAKEWNADSIFMGAHGLGRIERLLIGSVSSSVAARAHCSVEVVRFPGR